MASRFGGVPIQQGGSRFGGVPIEQNSPTAGQRAGQILDAGLANANAPFKQAEKNTAEAFMGAVDSTGQAMSEPFIGDNTPTFLKPADAFVRVVGKAGNAIGGTAAAALSPVVGGLSSAVEPYIPAVSGFIKDKLVPNDPRFHTLTPEEAHPVAMQMGGDLANAVMLGKAGVEGAVRSGAPKPAPYEPLQPVYDKVKAVAADTTPRQGFIKSNSSEPVQAPKATPFQPAQIKEAAGKYYASSEAKGGALAPQTFSKAIDEANSRAGFQSEEGRMFSGDDIVTKTLGDLNALKGKPLTLRGANEIDDTLGDRIGAAWRSGNTDQAIRLTNIRDTLRESYSKAGEGDMINPSGFQDWRTGDKLWSAYRAGDDMRRIIENGEKADVPSTAIKNGFKTFVKNEKNKAGLTAEEWAAANHAAKTGVVTAALKTAGSKIISGIAGGAGGAMGGGFPGAMAGAVAGEAVGYPMRLGATALQKGRGQAVIDMIGSRPDIQKLLNTSPTPPAPAQLSPVPFADQTLKSALLMSPNEARASFDQWRANRYAPKKK